MKPYSQEDFERVRESLKKLRDMAQDDRGAIQNILEKYELLLSSIVAQSNPVFLHSLLQSEYIQNILYTFVFGYAIGANYDIEEFGVDEMWINAINDIGQEEE